MNPEFIKIINKDGNCIAIRSKNIVSIETAEHFNKKGYSSIICVEAGDALQFYTAKETLADIEAQMYPVMWIMGEPR